TERLPAVEQQNRIFSSLPDFDNVRTFRIAGGQLLEHEIAVADDDADQVPHVMDELAIAVHRVESFVDHGCSADLPPGGGSLTTAQKAPSWRTASMNDLKSTGLTT